MEVLLLVLRWKGTVNVRPGDGRGAFDKQREFAFGPSGSYNITVIGSTDDFPWIYGIFDSSGLNDYGLDWMDVINSSSCTNQSAYGSRVLAYKSYNPSMDASTLIGYTTHLKITPFFYTCSNDFPVALDVVYLFRNGESDLDYRDWWLRIVDPIFLAVSAVLVIGWLAHWIRSGFGFRVRLYLALAALLLGAVVLHVFVILQDFVVGTDGFAWCCIILGAIYSQAFYSIIIMSAPDWESFRKAPVFYWIFCEILITARVLGEALLMWGRSRDSDLSFTGFTLMLFGGPMLALCFLMGCCAVRWHDRERRLASRISAWVLAYAICDGLMCISVAPTDAYWDAFPRWVLRTISWTLTKMGTAVVLFMLCCSDARELREFLDGRGVLNRSLLPQDDAETPTPNQPAQDKVSLLKSLDVDQERSGAAIPNVSREV